MDARGVLLQAVALLVDALLPAHSALPSPVDAVVAVRAAVVVRLRADASLGGAGVSGVADGGDVDVFMDVDTDTVPAPVPVAEDGAVEMDVDWPSADMVLSGGEMDIDAGGRTPAV